MADIINIDQESEDLKNESPLTTNEAENSNLKPVEKSMDTHAHHLHHAPGKKIWHYIFEFIMLFLAVTAGFFVENLRDSIGDKQKERQYIKSLIQDLQKDSMQYDFLITSYRDKNLKLDSAINILTSSAFFENPESFYKFYNDIDSYDDFIYTDGTMQQLKNAGGLRLIENEDVVDSIIAYDSYVRYSLRQQENVQQSQNKNIDMAIKNLNFSYNHQMKVNNKNNPILLTSNWNDILIFAGQIKEYRNECWVLHVDLLKNKKEAESLLLLLRKNFNLK